MVVSEAGVGHSQLSAAIAEVRGASGATVDSQNADQEFEALLKYGVDLTAKVAVLDPVIGRDEEIRRCIRILCRRTKNNPVSLPPSLFLRFAPTPSCLTIHVDSSHCMCCLISSNSIIAFLDKIPMLENENALYLVLE